MRLAKMRGEMVSPPSAGGHALHASYAAMAIANGVPQEHPALAPCRVGIMDDDDEIRTAYSNR